MARFPPGFLDDLKAQADIVQVVQEVVSLRRAGASHKGLCPFHTEKTPSFTVNGDRGFFHCFGCGTGGDVIKFVQLHESLTFPDAVQALAQRFGVQVPVSDDPTRDAAAETERETLLAVHERACDYFREQLAAPAGTEARAHLDARAVRPATAEQLGLGFAPGQREGLKRHLLDAGYSLDILLKSGLVVEREGARTVDRFRNRLTIPICRDGGSVVAFGGRALGMGQQPKYLNSPETPLYAKSRTLYGLHLTKKAIRRLGYAILVEGYFDLAQVVQGGIEPVVATCGTALTASQVRLLRRFASKVIVSFDPDAAGQAAAVRSGELLVAEGLEVNVALLPPGEDPDACVRRGGTAAFADTLQQSRPYLEFALERAAAGRDFTRDQPRRAFLSEMLALAARIPDPTARYQFADRLAQRARVTEDVIRAEIRKAAVARRTNAPTVMEDVIRAEARKAGVARADERSATMLQAEKALLWALVHDPAAALPVLGAIEPRDLEGLTTAPILEVALSLEGVSPAAVPGTLVERLDPDEAALVQAIAAESVAPATNAGDCWITLRKRRYRQELASLRDEIERKPAESDELLRRKLELHRLVKELDDRNGGVVQPGRGA
ncbi:MAG: DNA primase [Acidobacteria bacterium]|nr:DNA primase [Acidobacteriota bacterium]